MTGRAFAAPALALCACASSTGFTPHPPELGGLPEVFVARYSASRLPSGMTFELNSDPSLPLVSLALGVRGGPLTEPLDKAGTTALLASTMTIRTERLDRFQLAGAYDTVGDGVSVAVVPDGLVFQLDILPDQINAAIVLLAEMVRRPAFDEALLERAKDDELVGLSALESDPRAAALQGLRQVVFGTGHRLGLPLRGTRRTLAAATLADLQARYAELFRPENVVLAICGQVTENARAVVDRAFGDWRASGRPPRSPAPPPAARSRKTMYYIPRAGLPQTLVYIGRSGPPESDERHHLVRIANRRVVSSAGSWLRGMESITYGVGTLEESTSVAALYGARTQVDAPSTSHAVKTLLERFDARQEGGAFDRDKVLLLTAEALAQYRFSGRALYAADLFLRGLPPDHWSRLREHLDGIRDYGVESAVFEFIRSDEMQVVLVGDPEVIRAQNPGALQELRLALD
jgi:zinc protease